MLLRRMLTSFAPSGFPRPAVSVSLRTRSHAIGDSFVSDRCRPQLVVQTALPATPDEASYLPQPFRLRAHFGALARNFILNLLVLRWPLPYLLGAGGGLRLFKRYVQLFS
jgi:hypothetical protein